MVEKTKCIVCRKPLDQNVIFPFGSHICSNKCYSKLIKKRDVNRESNRKRYGTICAWCGKLTKNKIYCSKKCFEIRTHALLLSQRIQLKKRKGRKKCEICGFQDAIDVHHDIETKSTHPYLISGNSEYNRIHYLCPNHHHMIHRLGLSLEEVKERWKNR